MFAQNNSIIAGVYDTTMSFVDINPDTIIYSDPETNNDISKYNLDLNQDSIFDYQFIVTQWYSPGAGDGEISIAPYNNNEVVFGKVDTTESHDSVIVYNRVIHPFEFEEIIDSSSSYYKYNSVFLKYSWTDCGYPSDFSINWGGIGTKYVGIRMNIEDSLVYGWIKVEVIVGYPYKLIVKEYALSKNFNLNAGVEDELGYNIKHYPNPFDDYLIIQVPDNINISQIRIIDLFGRKQKAEINIESKSITINTTNLNKGMYILGLTVNDKVYSSKILKK